MCTRNDSKVSNKIYVGDKKIVSYIGAILNNLNENEDNSECHLVSRGSQNNGKALDIAEMARRDNSDLEIGSIELSTEEFINEDEIRQDESVEFDSVEEMSEEDLEEFVHRVTSVDVKMVRE